MSSRFTNLSPWRLNCNFFNPQISTDYHGLPSSDFDEVLKDRSFPVLQAEAKPSFASACKMEICAASALVKITFRLVFWMKSVIICENLWINKIIILYIDYAKR